MSNSTDIGFGYSDGDVDTNATPGATLNDLIAQRYSRRATLRSGAGAAVTAMLGGSMLAACDQGPIPGDPAPTVTVGQTGTARSGNIVTLTATAYDNGPISSIVFSQVSGPTVTLNPAGTTETSFMAPSVAAATAVVIRATVTDGSGNVVTSDTTVTIAPAVLGFAAVAKNKLDVVTVPAGYSVQIGARLGDPIAPGVAAFANDGTDTGYAQRIGDHGDALYWYGLNAAGQRDDNSSFRGLIVQNHENINQQYLHPAGPTAPGGARPEAEALKEIECHGVSVVEYAEGAGRKWSYVQNSAFNRRVTPNTPVTFAGPVAGTAWLRTAYSTNGTAGRGTINNCANGHTLWGTNLTCEENWAGYFKRAAGDNANRSAREITQLNRYGISQGAGGSYGWATVVPADPANTSFRRFDVTVDTTKPADGTGDYRYEANQFGWVVEIDPYDKTIAPGSAPRSAAWGMKAPGTASSSRARSWPSIWATTRAANISTNMSRTPPGTPPTRSPPAAWPSATNI